MSKVVFLGAGASVRAGYPLVSNLTDELSAFYKEKGVANHHQQACKEIEIYKKKARGVLKSIFDSNNPELFLTIPDILESALEDFDAVTWKKIGQSQKKNVNGNSISARWRSSARKKLEDGQKIKQAFQTIITHYFEHMHADFYEEKNNHYSYMENFLNELGSGDAVITTNWDTVVENALLKSGEFHLEDGYGFDVQFNNIPPANSYSPPNSSKVKLLKLHGSVGWFKNGSQVYLNQANYLQFFPGYENLQDVNSKTVSGPGHPADSFFIYPSYLKKINEPVLINIWEQASKFINNAEKVTFTGYSLPAGDVAIKALLLPLRSRFADGKVKITVNDPNEQVLERYRSLFGAEITTRKEEI